MYKHVNMYINMYKSVSSLNITKEDRGVKRTPNRTPWTLEVTNGTWPCFTTSEVRAALSNINPSKVAGPDKIHPRLLRHLGPKTVTNVRPSLAGGPSAENAPERCLAAPNTIGLGLVS